jgi:transposase
MLYAGIDWSDDWLDFELRTGDGRVLDQGRVRPSPAGMAELFSRLDRHAPPDEIGIAIESVRAAWIQALLDRRYTVYPLHPPAVDNFRRARNAAGNKTDKIDRQTIALFLATFHAELRALRPDAPDILGLRMLCQDRVHLVEERTAKSNELTSIVKVHCPFFMGFFGQIDSRIALQFLQEFPTQNQMRALSERKLRSWLTRKGYSHPKRVDEMVAHLGAPVLRVPDEEQEIRAGRMTYLARSLIELDAEIERVDKDITRRFDAMPESSWIRSLPGAGPVLGPCVLAVIGRDPNRFKGPTEAAGLVGTAPVTIGSGKQLQHRFRFGCWKFARRTFVMLAEHSRLAGVGWVVELYERQRLGERSHHRALRVIAQKWLKIILAMKRTGARYDESIFTHSQKRYLSNAAARAAT